MVLRRGSLPAAVRRRALQGPQRQGNLPYYTILYYTVLPLCLLLLLLTAQSLYTKIKSGVFHFKSHAWRDVSAPAADLVKSLLVTSQLHRPTALQALAHPWFQMSEGAPIHSIIVPVFVD